MLNYRFFLYLILTFASLTLALEATSVVSNSSAIQQTLSIIKPNAVQDNHIGEIIARFEKNGLRIAALKMIKLTEEQARNFYVEHKDRPFYKDLTTFMTSAPVVVMVLQGEDAVAKNRQIMGATDPSKAASGTIRADFAKTVTANAVHGSDSPESAAKEIRFFFNQNEIQNRF